MEQHENPEPEQSTAPLEDKEVYGGWRDAGLDEEEALRSTQADHASPGQNVAEKLDALEVRADANVKVVQAGLEVWNAALGGNVSALTAAVKERGAQIANLTATVKERGVQIANLSTQVANLTAAVKERGVQIAKLGDRIGSLALDVKTPSIESYARRSELRFLRGLILFLLGILALLVALGFIRDPRAARVEESTPAQSVHAPVAQESPRPSTTRETDLPKPLPQQAAHRAAPDLKSGSISPILPIGFIQRIQFDGGVRAHLLTGPAQAMQSIPTSACDSRH